MDATRRKQVAELASELHPLMMRLERLAVEERRAALGVRAASIVIEANPERYNATKQVDEAVSHLTTAIAVLIDLPLIGR